MVDELSPFSHKDVTEYLKQNYVNYESIDSYGVESCEAHFRDVLEWLCQPPKWTTVRVNTRVKSVSSAKEILQSYLIEAAQHLSCDIHEHPLLSDALVIKCKSLEKEVRPRYKEVIVDLACGVSVLRGSHVYAPGVMSAHPALSREEMVSVYADVDKKCLRGLVKPFDGTKLFLGNGRCCMDRKDIFSSNKPSGLAVEMVEQLHPNPSLGSVLNSTIFLQNLPSVVCGHVLSPKPGELILDMCAAPGGKTIHIATLMKNEGRLIALDRTLPKVSKINSLVESWGTSCVEAYAFDSTKALIRTLPQGIISNTGSCSPPPYPANTFDRILLDAPCSALGQRPQIKNSISLPQLKSYSSLQKKLFTVAVELLKPGGVLVYSTCTLVMAENEEIVRWALDKFPCLNLVPQSPRVGYKGQVGAGLPEEKLSMLQRFGMARDPQTTEDVDINFDTIGFFIAKFEKK